MNKTQLGYLYGMGAVLIWSGFILVSRLGGISELNHYDIIAISYSTCALLLLPVWLCFYRFNFLKPKFLVIGLFGGIAYALCTFYGFQLAPASHAALLLPGAMPLLAVLLASRLNTDSISKGKWLGASIITFGIALLFINQSNTESTSLMGDLLFLTGAFFWTIMSVLIKRWDISPWQVTSSLAFVTCLLYLPVYLLALPKNIHLDLLPDIATQMLYQGFLATIIQMLLFVQAVRLLGATTMGSLMAIVPVISGIGAFIWLDEALTGPLIAGLVLVTFGAWVANAKPKGHRFNPFSKPQQSK